MKEKEKITFKPASKGLGFHPFSDGLPYAPVSKRPGYRENQELRKLKPQAEGVGAVAAGRPSFVIPQRITSPRIDPTPLEKQKTLLRQPEIAPSSLLKDIPLTPKKLANVTFNHPEKAPQKTQAFTAEPTQIEDKPGLLFLVKRTLSYLIDTLVNVSLCSAIVAATFWALQIHPGRIVSMEFILLSVLFLGVFSWSLITAQEVAFHTSLGKRLFRIEVDAPGTTLLLRSLFFLISLSMLGLGLFWALFDKKRRCWHDIITDSSPMEIARL